MALIKKIIRASTMPVTKLVRTFTKPAAPSKPQESPAAVGKNIFGTFDASKPHRRSKKG